MHSNIVRTAPVNLSIRSFTCSGPASKRSRVPRPGHHNQPLNFLICMLPAHHSLGQLKPSKSTVGRAVIGLTDRLALYGGVGGASSLESLAGTCFTSSSCFVAAAGPSWSPSCAIRGDRKSIGCRRGPFDDLMLAYRFSRSLLSRRESGLCSGDECPLVR